MVFVLTCVTALYPLASFLADNAPGALERRYATDNAPVVAAVRQVYAANDWPGMGVSSCEANLEHCRSTCHAACCKEDPVEVLAFRENP